MKSLRKWSKSLYQIRLGTAVLLSLPILIWFGWLIAISMGSYYRLAALSAGRDDWLPLNPELVRYFIRDQIKRLELRTGATEMPLNSELPLVQMSVSAENLAELNRDLPASGKSTYFRAYLKWGDETHTVKARYVGDNHWHWLYPQKSWKIKTKRSQLINGSRLINLKNPRTRLAFNEVIAMELGKELGLVAPRVFPVRFVLNSQYMGVYLWQDPMEESTIRRSRRMPGSLYSGDGAPRNSVTGVSMLWEDERYWEKSASRGLEYEEDRSEIGILLEQVNNASLVEFYEFAKRHLNLQAYAHYLSLDNLTACAIHDYHHNHKIYFDPVTGKFEPAAWDANEWNLKSRSLDLVLNPLLVRFKLIPEFEFLRHRTLFENLTTGALTKRKIVERFKQLDGILRPCLEADVFKNFRDNWSRRFMKIRKTPVVVYDMAQYEEQLGFYLNGIDERVDFLMTYLNNASLEYSLERGKNSYLLRITSSGNVAARVTELKVVGEFQRVGLFRDRNGNEEVDDADELIAKGPGEDEGVTIELDEILYPGYEEALQKRHALSFGTFDLVPSPLAYTILIDVGEGRVEEVSVTAANAVNEASIVSRYEEIREEESANSASLHPWKLRKEALPETLRIGPGEIIVDENLEYSEKVTLEIAAGTTLLLEEKVSLFSFGRVVAKGTAANPIRIKALHRGKPWGAFVLQGRGANGSLFEHCIWSDGSRAERSLIEYSGAVSLHDVDDVTLRNCTFLRNHVGDDSLRLAYCDNALVEGCTFLDSAMDAFDADICRNLRITNSRFRNSGDDAIDLMTTDASIESSVFDTARDKGVSVGEDSHLVIDKCLFRDCVIGLQIKDRSQVQFRENLIDGSPVAIDLQKKNWRYDGGGLLEAGDIYVVNCERDITYDAYSRVSFGEVVEQVGYSSYWDGRYRETALQAPLSN